MPTLVHTPIDVPDDQMKVTSLRQLDLGCGIAYTARVAYRRTRIGTLENHGDGGMTFFYPSAPNAGTHMLAFLAGCRDLDGAKPSDEDIFEALITEYETRRDLTRLLRRHPTVVRFAGPTVTGSLSTWSRPITDAAGRDTLRRALLKQPDRGGQWQLWTGSVWQPLADIADDGTPTVHP